MSSQSPFPSPSRASTPSPNPSSPRSQFQLRPDETLLFRGDVSRLRGGLKGLDEGQGVITNQRCVFRWGSDVLEITRSELTSVEARPHGLTTKVDVRHGNGRVVTVTAANAKGLKNALLALADMPYDAAALNPPDPASVKNRTVWVAALGPIWADLTVMFLAAILHWNLDQISGLQVLKVLLLKVAIIYAFIRVDHLNLQRQGFDTVSLGIDPPESFPMYFFSRAKAFGHGKSYAITWCVLAAMELIWLLN